MDGRGKNRGEERVLEKGQNILSVGEGERVCGWGKNDSMVGGKVE